MTILVAEDEEDIGNLIETQLVMEGYQVCKVTDGYAALQCILHEDIDIALLDIMMPKLDGLSVLRKVREVSDIPIIFVTARGAEIDRVSGLSLGADDYLVKPFSLNELSARVAVQCRHIRNYKHIDQELSTGNQILKCADLVIDQDACSAIKNGEKLDLNAKEYLLLKYFMENKGRVLTKKQIYQAVWGDEYLYDDNTIMVHLSRLRNKLGESAKGFTYIVTFKGLGYKFVDGEDCNV